MLFYRKKVKSMVSKDDVMNALKQIADPHMGISIVDMGLINDVEVSDEGVVSFTLTPTNPGCMSVIHMAGGAKHVRITSYNVCYTKLLRDSRPAHGHQHC